MTNKEIGKLFKTWKREQIVFAIWDKICYKIGFVIGRCIKILPKCRK